MFWLFIYTMVFLCGPRNANFWNQVANWKLPHVNWHSVDQWWPVTIGVGTLAMPELSHKHQRSNKEPKMFMICTRPPVCCVGQQQVCSWGTLTSVKGSKYQSHLHNTSKSTTNLYISLRQILALLLVVHSSIPKEASSFLFLPHSGSLFLSPAWWWCIPNGVKSFQGFDVVPNQKALYTWVEAKTDPGWLWFYLNGL